jgi:ATP-dependent exoDNAse (exonuclease V) beta subunit
MNIKDKFKHINFNADKHYYYSNSGDYVSVTTLIHKYTPFFDKEAISKKVADKQGIPQDEVKALWDIKRDYACVKGTEFHLYVETFLLYGRKIETFTGIEHEIEQFHIFWDKNKDKYEVVNTELIVGTESLMIAGMVDCLVRHKATGKYFIWDWKSNREIKMNNKWQKLKQPLEYLDDCNMNHYKLQTSIYKTILEMEIPEIEVMGSCLIYFKPNSPYQVIHCNYMRDEMFKIFDNRQMDLTAKRQ